MPLPTWHQLKIHRNPQTNVRTSALTPRKHRAAGLNKDVHFKADLKSEKPGALFPATEHLPALVWGQLVPLNPWHRGRTQDLCGTGSWHLLCPWGISQELRGAALPAEDAGGCWSWVWAALFPSAAWARELQHGPQGLSQEES